EFQMWRPGAIAPPIGALSWLAITILCLYVLLFTDPSSSRQRGAAHSARNHRTNVLESFTVYVFRQFHFGNRRCIGWLAIGHRTYGQSSSLRKNLETEPLFSQMRVEFLAMDRALVP